MSDSFLDAFDKLAGLGETPSGADVATAMASVATETMAGAEGADTVQAAAETVQGAEGADTIQAAAETIQGAEGADTSQGAEGADTVQGAADPAPKPAAGEDDEAFLRRLRALVTPADDAATKPPARTETEEAPIYTKDEQDFLSAYEKDWPDVAKAESLRRRAEYRKLLEYVFTEVGSYMRPHLEALDAIATRTHLTELTGAVPDYDTVRDQVVKWVSEQPKYLQPAYQHVIERGTADEVSDLISRWRTETKQQAPAPATAPKPKDTVLPPAAKQAAAAMAPVGSKRSATQAGIDPADFNSAFEAAAAADKL